MKLTRTIAALTLAGALLLGSAGAFTVDYGGVDWGYPDELADLPVFQEGLEQTLRQARAEGWSAETFSDAMGQVCEAAAKELDRQTNDQIMAHEGEEAQCDFDPATGTVLRVLNDAPDLYIPSQIGGVTVRAIAPGAVAGKKSLEHLSLPTTVEEIHQPVAVDCPELWSVSAHPDTLVTCKLYENCPLADLADLEDPYQELEIKAVRTGALTSGQPPKPVELPQRLMTYLKVFQGSDKGMNWTGELTRAEAATVLLRLLGLEAEAQEAAGRPCPFSDVPDWAKGYVNLAYEKGMVKGVGGDRFDPSGLCKAREFALMLLRLTDHAEGRDYAWATAVTDAQLLIRAGRELTVTGNVYLDSQLFPRLYNDNRFSREYACALTFRMLSAPLADGKSSLGDKLCAENGLSTAALADHLVRLTPAALAGRVTPAEATGDDFRLRSLLIAMDDDKKAEVAQDRPAVSPEVQTLVDGLVAGKGSDYAKAQAISTWVADHIAYDYDTFEGRANAPQDPAAVLAGRRAVCDGFANLTQVMMAAADIPCVKVTGFAQSQAHAWNEVYADGRWFPVDNTWDCAQDYRNGSPSPNSRGAKEHFDMDYPAFYTEHMLDPFQSEHPGVRYFS